MDQVSGFGQHVVLVSKVGLERRHTRMWFWSARQARKVCHGSDPCPKEVRQAILIDVGTSLGGKAAFLGAHG